MDLILGHSSVEHSLLMQTLHFAPWENGVEWSGVEWNGMEWNGMEWVNNKIIEGLQ